jgi:hypothetical protein
MKNYLAILVAKLQSVIKPSIWQFIPLLAGQLKAALAAKDTAKILALADRIEATAHEEREHADSMDALAAHLRVMVADGEVDALEAAEGLELLQEMVDQGEDIATGKDEDDPV